MAKVRSARSRARACAPGRVLFGFLSRHTETARLSAELHNIATHRRTATAGPLGAPRQDQVVIKTAYAV